MIPKGSEWQTEQGTEELWYCLEGLCIGWGGGGKGDAGGGYIRK